MVKDKLLIEIIKIKENEGWKKRITILKLFFK